MVTPLCKYAFKSNRYILSSIIRRNFTSQINSNNNESNDTSKLNDLNNQSYDHNSDIWKNIKQFPVLPDYELLRSCLYINKMDDFNNLKNQHYAPQEDVLLPYSNDYNKMEEIISKYDPKDPAIVIMYATILSKQNKIEEAKFILLNFISSSLDTISNLYCYTLLRELGHKVNNPDEVLGIIFEIATENGNDITAIYKDRSCYSIYSGGRSGFYQYFPRYPFYTDIELLKKNSTNDISTYGDLDIMISNDVRFALYNQHVAQSVVNGSPIDSSHVTPLYNPKAKCESIFDNETESTIGPNMANTQYSNVPARITFLTPGGKRTIESEYFYFKSSSGGIRIVHMLIEKISKFIKIVKCMQTKKGRPFPRVNFIATSEYVLRKWGFDRYSAPDLPLTTPLDLLDSVKLGREDLLIQLKDNANNIKKL